MGKFEKAYSILERELARFGGGAMLYVAMLYVSFNVIGRYIFHYPLLGMYECVALAMVPMGCLAFAYGWRVPGTYITVNFLIFRIKGKLLMAVKYFIQVFSLLFFAIPLIWGGFFGTTSITWAYLEQDSFGSHGAFTIVTWPFRAILLLGLLLLTIRIVLEIIKLYQKRADDEVTS